jgi:hypothetical protein
MSEEFQRAYQEVRTALGLDPVGSAQFHQLLALWLTSGAPKPIDVFLIVHAPMTRETDDDAESEADTHRD